jgi:hypothetical protein
MGAFSKNVFFNFNNSLNNFKFYLPEPTPKIARLQSFSWIFFYEY